MLFCSFNGRPRDTNEDKPFQHMHTESEWCSAIAAQQRKLLQQLLHVTQIHCFLSHTFPLHLMSVQPHKDAHAHIYTASTVTYPHYQPCC